MKKTGPASTEVTCEDLKTKADGKLNLAYFGDLEGADYDAFMATANHPSVAELFAFFHTSDKDCAG